MNGEKNSDGWTWTHTQAVALFTASLFYIWGQVLVDYGASMALSPGVVAQSLMFSSMPPHVVYHAGIWLSLMGFMLLFVVGVRSLF